MPTESRCALQISNNMNWLIFFKSFFTSTKKTGSITPSSIFLSKKIALLLPKDARIVVELGGGTGSITKALLNELSPDSILYCVESNQSFVKILKEINDSRLKIIEGDATHILKLFNSNLYGKIDVIISSIPISYLKKEKVTTMISDWHSLLTPKGLCIQYQYMPLSQKKFSSFFRETSLKFELFNVPPTYIYVAKK